VKSQKIIAIFFIIIVNIGIISILNFFLSGTSYSAYLNHCSEIKLPIYKIITTSEIVFAPFIIMIYIFAKQFRTFNNLSYQFYKYILLLLTVNFIYLSINIIQFPLVYRKISFLTATDKFIENNPLLIISLIHLLILIVLNFKFRKHLNKFFNFTIYIITITLMIIQLIITYFVEFKQCLG